MIATNINKSGIYRIQNILNDKCYIGSAVRLRQRSFEHLCSLNNKSHDNQKLQRAFDKYGKENFKFDVLLICSKEDLLMYEQRAIDAYDSAKNGYNIRLIATSNLGIKYSDESKKKMSESSKNRIVTDETKRKISESNKGRKHTDETRAKMTLAKTGVVKSEETCRKLSIAHKGKRPSDKCIEAAIKANKGRIRSVEEIKQLTESMKGNSYSLGLHWYTNGIVNKVCAECPEGFRSGKTRKSTFSPKGLHQYNNEIVSVMRKECPNGFIPGMLKREKS